MSLVVTILGDGRGTSEYQKREDLRDRLLGHRFVDEVTLPELLFERNQFAHLEDVERSAIEAADVVICLEGPQGPPLGMYTEVVAYLVPGSEDKWYRVAPWDRENSESAEPLVSGLANEILRLVETQRYERTAWSSCDRITAACVARVDLVGLRSAGIPPSV